MEYRINRRTGDRLSAMGLGTSTIVESDEKEIVATLQEAHEKGVNFFDLATAESLIFAPFGRALGDVRSEIFCQIHFGAMYGPGKSYARSLNLEKIKRSVDWQLEQLGFDYVDYGMIHCLDEMGDWKKYRDNGDLAFLEDLKRQGVVRHIGFSTHTPAVANAILDLNVADMMLFSINPGYDYQHGEFAHGTASERMALYQRCESMGVGISVMKVFSSGQLLNQALSPFGEALTAWQCMQYALDKPGVLTLVPGVRDRAQLEELLGFFDASPEERDYTAIARMTPADMEGRCVYCNHCQPCPEGIDVGLVNKYYDLAKAGDALAADHYRRLEKAADACTGCGHCDRRCPFHVKQSERMQTIRTFFG